jgi:hypothetical protein
VNSEVEVIWKEADIAADIARRGRGTQWEASVTHLDCLVWLHDFKNDDSIRLQMFALGSFPVIDSTVA